MISLHKLQWQYKSHEKVNCLSFWQWLKKQAWIWLGLNIKEYKKIIFLPRAFNSSSKFLLLFIYKCLPNWAFFRAECIGLLFNVPVAVCLLLILTLFHSFSLPLTMCCLPPPFNDPTQPATQTDKHAQTHTHTHPHKHTDTDVSLENVIITLSSNVSIKLSLHNLNVCY